MKTIFSASAAAALIAALLCAAPGAASAALVDEDPSEAVLSTDTVKTDDAADEEEAQAQIQESDEDLVGYVGDYIKKDVALKGAFLLENSASKKILKLKLDSVLDKVEAGAENTKIVTASFKDAAGRKYNVLFHLQGAGFSDVDIFKIELKKEEKQKAPAAGKDKKQK